ncbi:MAG: hypothetical protein LDL33_07875 [Desulfomonile sp.]|nr:hypothetical protein [Desulfomonile sp.]
MTPMVHELLQHLQGRALRRTEDRLNHVGTGAKLEALVWIDRTSLTVTVEKSVDEVGSVEDFIVNGKWEAHVRKDKFHIGRLYDKVWGDDERPYGFFAIRMRCRDGVLTGSPHIEIMVEDPDQEPKSYALRFAEELVRSKVADALE